MRVKYSAGSWARTHVCYILVTTYLHFIQALRLWDEEFKAID